MTTTARTRKLEIVPQTTAPTPRTRAPRQAKAPVDPRTLGVVDQVRIAFRPTNRLALVWGVLLGAGVPVATYTLAHDGLARAGSHLYFAAVLALVLGGLAFSAKSVFAWCRQAFQDGT